MDFSNAALLIGAIVGGVELVKRLALKIANYVIDDGVTQVVAMVVAVALMFLARATVWGSTQVIGEHGLDKLGIADIIFAAVLLGLVGNFADRLVRSIANIGENNPKPPR